MELVHLGTDAADGLLAPVGNPETTTCMREIRISAGQMLVPFYQKGWYPYRVVCID
jgi:hypothetical protein